MKFILPIMLLLLLLPTVQAIVSVIIQDKAFALYLSNQNGVYIVHTKDRDNYSYYSYPIEELRDFSYDGNFKRRKN